VILLPRRGRRQGRVALNSPSVPAVTHWPPPGGKTVTVLLMPSQKPFAAVATLVVN